jgi:hypothetical protein
VISELSRSFLSWALIFPTAFLVGSHFRRLIPIKDTILRGVFYFALGFAALSYGIVLLNALRLIHSLWIWIGLVTLLLSGIKSIDHLWTWLKEILNMCVIDGPLRLRFLKGMAIASFAALLCGSLTPEIGGDALTYHLNLPKTFLMQGSIEPNYFDLNSYFPLFLNNLYLIGLATGGVISAKLFHFVCGALLFLSLLRTIFNLTHNEILTWFFATIFWLTPSSFNLLSTSYNDVALAFYTFLSLLSLINGLEENSRRAVFLSGLLLGFGMTIKYLAMISFVGFIGIWIFQFFKGKFSTAASLAIWISAFMLGCGYWLAKTWLLTGNPVFPYFASVFGTVPYLTRYQSYGVGHSLFDFIAVFWGNASPSNNSDIN